MRSAASAMRHAKRPNGTMVRASIPHKAAPQHESFADLVAASGAAIEWLTDADDGLADSVFTHDPSLMTDHGAIILSMGKALAPARARRCTKPPTAHGHSDPRPHRSIRARSRAATASGSTPRRWPSAAACAPTRHGIQQMSNLLGPQGVEVLASTCRSGMARKPACI